MRLSIFSLLCLILIGCSTASVERNPAGKIRDKMITLSASLSKTLIPNQFRFNGDFEEFACEAAKLINPSGDENDVQQKRDAANKVLSEIVSVESELESAGSPFTNAFAKAAFFTFTSEADLLVDEALVLQGEKEQHGAFAMALQNLASEGPLIGQKGLYEKIKSRQKELESYHDSFKFTTSPGANARERSMRYSSNVEALSSPFVEWVVQQPDGSLSPKKVLEAAIAIYEDPWMALGVIAWSAEWSANLGTDRSKTSIVSEKMKPVFVSRNSDHPGTIYHFWGYLARVVFQPLDYTRLSLMTFAYESAYQRDHQDSYADYWALRSGMMINYFIKNPTNQVCDRLDELKVGPEIPIQTEKTAR